MSQRTDGFGRAYAGSQLQIQTYVNRRRAELNTAILHAIPELGTAGAHLEWVSPVEDERFKEYQDGGFLSALGLLEVSGMLAEFWPQGGPVWDALARVTLPGSESTGVLLVEAKSYPQEMYSSGCCASDVSRGQIVRALQRTQQWLELEPADWTGPLYQSANRLAHLYFLRELAGVPTWFVNLCFAGDPHRPTPPTIWRDALKAVKVALCLPETVPFCADIILEAAGRELFQTHAPVFAAGVICSGAGSANKAWRFLRSERLGRHQFLAFANARGSSSLRLFDAESGVLMGDPRYGTGRTYQEVFAREMAASEPVDGPGAVSFSAIPWESLRAMREQVGLNGMADSVPATRFRSSILAGVDDLVDEALGVSQIGQTAPHYRHLRAYRAVAAGPRIDGSLMISGMYRTITANWPGSRCRGGQNWRWEKQTYISDANESIEKQFEKAIAAQCPEWVNMIPVASGVLPDMDEGGRRIDLARCCAKGDYEFLELKLGQHCDTPLHAAIELLGYGLIYLFSREHCDRLGYDPHNPLLTATRIGLRVVAPAASYGEGSLLPFEDEVNRGLMDLVTVRFPGRPVMDFSFEHLPADFDWRPGSGSAGRLLERRTAVYDSRHGIHRAHLEG
jgi:hypothetical protein